MIYLNTKFHIIFPPIVTALPPIFLPPLSSNFPPISHGSFSSYLFSMDIEQLKPPLSRVATTMGERDAAHKARCEFMKRTNRPYDYLKDHEVEEFVKLQLDVSHTNIAFDHAAISFELKLECLHKDKALETAQASSREFIRKTPGPWGFDNLSPSAKAEFAKRQRAVIAARNARNSLF